MFDEKPIWHSESKLAEFIHYTPRHQTVHLPVIAIDDKPYFHQEELDTERKVNYFHWFKVFSKI
jgi:hypothetical protein